jgi:hypothetical protein
MVLAKDIYQSILDVARKDARGRSLSVEEFNTTARVVNELIFSKYYADFEDTQEVSETMSAFKVLDESIAVGAGGVAPLPATYFYMCGMPKYLGTDGSYKYLDLVSSLEHAKREQDYLTKATLEHPTFRFGIATATSAMTMYVTPSAGINPVIIDYIRMPNTPFLDYYVNNTTAEYTFMAAGATVAVPLGCTARNGTAGLANVASSTVNFEWSDSDLPLILSLFMKQLGIQLPSPELYEGGMRQETQLDEQ